MIVGSERLQAMATRTNQLGVSVAEVQHTLYLVEEKWEAIRS